MSVSNYLGGGINLKPTEALVDRLGVAVGVYPYIITKTLVNCTISNNATSIMPNNSYSATLIADTGYSMRGGIVTITMGGVDITSTAYSGRNINIASVTGDITISAEAVVSLADPIYGVEWVNDTSTTMTRTDDSVGMSYAINSSTGEVASDFDNVFPWNEAEIVTDNAGNKFLRMPDMYFRIGNDENDDINSVAVSKIAGEEGTWYLCESFDWGIYGGSLGSDGDVNTLKSVSGESRVELVTITECRTWATNNSEYDFDNEYTYCLTDLKHRTVMMFLWWIEFATKCSADVMSGHIQKNNGSLLDGQPCRTGGTDFLGSTSTGYDVYTYQMRYHYIEDFVGNFSEYIDGLQIRRYGNFYVTDDPQYFGDEYSNGTHMYFTTRNSGSRGILGYAYDPNTSPFLIVPSQVTSDTSRTTGFCGNMPRNDNYTTSGRYYYSIGSWYDDSAVDSITNLASILYSSTSFTAGGARLMRVPTNGGV